LKSKIKAFIVLVFATAIFTICLIYSVKMEPRDIFKTNGYFLDNKENKNYNSGSFGVENATELQLRMKLSTGNEEGGYIKLVSPSGKIYEKIGSDIKSSEIVKAEEGIWSFEIDGKNSKLGKFTLQVIEEK
jgi:hypothetical protein